jgi:hypothetical protein
LKNKPKSALDNQTFWIYGLFAFSKFSDKKACYIGQTVNLKRRLKEHHKNKRFGKGSHSLHSWADEEGTNLKCIILSKIIGNQQEASILENYWFGLAKLIGFETPNSEFWANSKKSQGYIGDFQVWPESLINSRLEDLSMVVDQGVQIQSV